MALVVSGGRQDNKTRLPSRIIIVTIYNHISILGSQETLAVVHETTCVFTRFVVTSSAGAVHLYYELATKSTAFCKRKVVFRKHLKTNSSVALNSQSYDNDSAFYSTDLWCLLPLDNRDLSLRNSMALLKILQLFIKRN